MQEIQNLTLLYRVPWLRKMATFPRFWVLVILISDLFRISRFGFRIWSEALPR
jgi:hypothetical protein